MSFLGDTCITESRITAWPNGLSAGEGWGMGQKLPLVEFEKYLLAADEFYLNPVLLEGLCSSEDFNAFVSKLHCFVKMGAVRVCFETVEGPRGVFNKRSVMHGFLLRGAV